ncbi:MAG: CopG family transcriptional regulator [Sulfurovum sp.]|nr:CopG family transcriptional regulator [Sulfurovum sp.]
MEYIAFIHKEDDSYVSVVPDLEYTSSFGSTFTEAVHNIVEACELYAEDEEVLPMARSLEQLTKEEELDAKATPQLINVKVEKNVRINVMLPAGLLRDINTRAKELYHGNRSAYIQDLMQRDIYIQA